MHYIQSKEEEGGKFLEHVAQLSFNLESWVICFRLWTLGKHSESITKDKCYSYKVLPKVVEISNFLFVSPLDILLSPSYLMALVPLFPMIFALPEIDSVDFPGIPQISLRDLSTRLQFNNLSLCIIVYFIKSINFPSCNNNCHHLLNLIVPSNVLNSLHMLTISLNYFIKSLRQFYKYAFLVSFYKFKTKAHQVYLFCSKSYTMRT